MPHIMGYSERGLVNALFESILAAADPVAVLTKMLETATLVENRHSVVKFRLYSPIRDFKVFVEPSLSQFGNPDVLLLLNREPKEGDSLTTDRVGPYTDAIFIEAKIEGFEQSVNRSPELRENASTVLHELFLKARFAHYLRTDEERIHAGVPVYDADLEDKPRKKKLYARTVGTDRQVLDLVDQMRGCHFYFFALTTDRGHPASEIAGSFHTGTRIGELEEKIRAANVKADPDLHDGWVKGWWEELSFLWSWHDLREEAQWYASSVEPAMQRLMETIEWNRSKFRFPSLHDGQLNRLLADFALKAGLDERGGRKNPDHRTFYKNRKAKFTCRIADSFDGPVLETYLLMPDKTRPEVTVPFRDLETFVNEGAQSKELNMLTAF